MLGVKDQRMRKYKYYREHFGKGKGSYLQFVYKLLSIIVIVVSME